VPVIRHVRREHAPPVAARLADRGVQWADGR
jgi:hypothetical protein